MMAVEFIEALREIGYTDAAVGRDIYRAVEAFYNSPRLDEMFAGMGSHARHVRMARWVADNQRRVMRLANRYSRDRQKQVAAIRHEMVRLQLELAVL